MDRTWSLGQDSWSGPGLTWTWTCPGLLDLDLDLDLSRTPGQESGHLDSHRTTPGLLDLELLDLDEIGVTGPGLLDQDSWTGPAWTGLLE